MASPVPPGSPSSRPQFSSNYRPQRSMSGHSMTAFGKQQNSLGTSASIRQYNNVHPATRPVVQQSYRKRSSSTSESDGVAGDAMHPSKDSLVSQARRNWMQMDHQVSGGHPFHSQGTPSRSMQNLGSPKSDRAGGSNANASRQTINRGDLVSPFPRSPGALKSRWNTDSDKVRAPQSWHGGKSKLSPSIKANDWGLRSPPLSSSGAVQPPGTDLRGTEVMKKRSLFEDDKSLGSTSSSRWKNSSGTPQNPKNPSLGRLNLPPHPIPDLNASMSSMAPQLPKRYQDPKQHLANGTRNAGIRINKSKTRHQENAATTIVRGSKVYKLQTVSKESFLSSSLKSVDDSRSWIRHHKTQEPNQKRQQDWKLNRHHCIIPEQDNDLFVPHAKDGSEETASMNTESYYRVEGSETVSETADDLEHDDKASDPDSDASARRNSRMEFRSTCEESPDSEHKIEGDGAAPDGPPAHLHPTVEDDRCNGEISADIGDYQGLIDEGLHPLEKSEHSYTDFRQLNDEELKPVWTSEPHETDEQDIDDDELHPVEKCGPHETLVVDKVPRKKRWPSRNVDNLPLWPPIIRILTFERRNTSGISVGSGFSGEDALTASEGDFESSFGEDDLCSFEDLKYMPPEQRTSYRIRYDGPTNLENLDAIYRLSPVPSHDDRFESTEKSPSDGMPNLPRRDDRSDGTPRKSRRQRQSITRDDLSIDTEKIGSLKSRPDVWITPLSGVEAENAIWKVKRVWAVEEEDEKEEEHSVHNKELFRKIKSLVGAPESPTVHSAGAIESATSDALPRKPNRSWHVRTVVERKGKLDHVQPEQDFAEKELEKEITVMAEQAVTEVNTNERAIEEAKKRIKMLKAGVMPSQRMPSRRNPNLSKLKQQESTDRSATEKVTENESFTEATTIDLKWTLPAEVSDQKLIASSLTDITALIPNEQQPQEGREKQQSNDRTATEKVTENESFTAATTIDLKWPLPAEVADQKLIASSLTDIITAVIPKEQQPQEGRETRVTSDSISEDVCSEEATVETIDQEKEKGTKETISCCTTNNEYGILPDIAVELQPEKNFTTNGGDAIPENNGLNTGTQTSILQAPIPLSQGFPHDDDVTLTSSPDAEDTRNGTPVHDVSQMVTLSPPIEQNAKAKKAKSSKSKSSKNNQSQTASETRAKSRRKLLTTDDVPKNREASRSPVRSESRRKLLSRDDTQKRREVSKSPARSASRRKLMCKDDAPKTPSRSSRNLSKGIENISATSTRSLDVELLSPGSNDASTKKKKKKSKGKEISQFETEQETSKTKKEHQKGIGANDNTNIYVDSPPGRSNSSGKDTPASLSPQSSAQFYEMLTPRRMRIQATSMVHNSDSEGESNEDSNRDEALRPVSKTTLTSTLLKDSAKSHWWQKSGDEGRSQYTTSNSPRDTRSMARTRRGGRRLPDES